MTILNATTLRNNLYKVLEDVIATHIPATITGKSGNAVIMSEEDYSALQETLYISSIPGMRDRLIKELHKGLEDCVEDIEDPYE